MTILTFVRHGTTQWMEIGKLHGITDSPLSEQGKSEAAATAEFLSNLHFDAFYTSPLGRAVETANIIAGQVGLTPQPLDGLRERDFGAMEGRPHFGDVKLPPLIKPLFLGLVSGIIHFTGEKRSNFKKRVLETARYIVNQHPEQKVLAVVHTAVQSHLIALLVDENPQGWLKYNKCPPCSISEIEVLANGQCRLLKFGANDHIPAENQKS